MVSKRWIVGLGFGLSVAGLGLLRAPGADAQGAGTLPKELAKLAADPQPGTMLAESAGKPVWAVLESLDVKSGFGVARGEADKKTYQFRLLPYANLWRFGAPGAVAEDYRPGERLVLLLAGEKGKDPKPEASYLVALRDEISEQVRLGQGYRMVSQNQASYTFTAERIDTQKGEVVPEPLTIEYGRDTALVLNEDPIYVFKVPVGTKLWINTGYRGSNPRMARETLDEVTASRFRRQQALRMTARANASGASGYVAEGGSAIQVFPGYTDWARQLAVGEAVRVARAGSDPGAGSTAKIKNVAVSEQGAVLTLEGSAGGVKAREVVQVVPVARTLSYKRDVQPLIEVNCLSCHRDGRSLGGYSLATREKLLAGGNRGVAIVPGKSAESLFYLTMTGERNPKMPPDREPTKEQLAIIRQWIDEGAKTE